MDEMIVLHIVHDFLFNFVCIPNELIYKQKLIYKTETDSQTSKTNLWLPKGKVGGRRDKLEIWDSTHYYI